MVRFGKEIVGAVRAGLKGPAVRQRIVMIAMHSLSAAGVAFAAQLRRIGLAKVDVATDDSIEPAPEFGIDEDPGLATLGEVEIAIFDVEEVEIVFIHPKSKRDVRDDRRGFTPYSYIYKLSDDLTVADLIRRRMVGYESHGLKALVMDRKGNVAHGGTRLGNVRMTYEQSERVGL